MEYKNVTAKVLVDAWNEMGKPAFRKDENDFVTAIRNTAMVVDESLLMMPIHVGQPLLNFIEQKQWNSQQNQVPTPEIVESSNGPTPPAENGQPDLRLVMLED